MDCRLYQVGHAGRRRLTVGHDYLEQTIRIAVVVDGLEALLFAAYLLTTRHAARPEPSRV